MLTKKQLEIILSQLKEPLFPKLFLEQYTIPGSLAAEILNLAYLHGDIKNKVVFDLGCGTGRLAIGAALLGAKEVVGVDVDEKVLEIAKENVESIISKFNKKFPISFVHSDIAKFKGKCDTVVQNPPFGIQTLHADRIFLEKALECGKRIYSLHKNGYRKTRKFLTKFVESKEGKVEQIIKFKFSIPYMFKFHEKPRVSYDVDLYIIQNVK